MFEIEFYADYADTDAMGVVHHSNYFKWFERARSAWFRSMGFPYAEFEKRNMFLPIRSAGIEYFRPVYFDELVKLTVRAEHIGRVDVLVKAEVRVAEELRVEGHTRHVLCERIDQKFVPKMISDEWRKRWQAPNVQKS